MKKRIPGITVVAVTLAVAFAVSGLAGEGKFVPPDGKTLLVIGSDKTAIKDYVDTTAAMPAGFMTYTSVSMCTGLDEATDLGNNIMHGEFLVDSYPGTVLQMGLYMVGMLEDIAAGAYDENIDTIGDWIAKTKRPVYLRIGYEFDFPENHYEPELYVRAYRHIVDRLRQRGVDNVAYVWHSYASSVRRPHMDWYPGDAYVDWFGVSFFNNQSSPSMQQMLALAREHQKPMMIAEATPYRIGATAGMKAYYHWYRPLFKFIKKEDIKMLCYINTDWDSKAQFAAGHWGDSRIEKNDEIRKLWFDEVNGGRYLQASKGLYKLLGFGRQ